MKSFPRNLFNRSRSDPSTTIESSTTTLMDLWREFLPLSLSDVTMACGDPLITTTLAHLPEARTNLAAVGVAKVLAIFLESPIIMILHASNALASTQVSRRALWRFVLILSGSLSAGLMLLGLPIIFGFIGDRILGVPPHLSPTVQHVILLMGVWPFTVAWRRYFQGLLIHQGKATAVAKASLCRLGSLAAILGMAWLWKWPGATVAGLALSAGVVVEAIAVTMAARRYRVTFIADEESARSLPRTIPAVVRFYWPLANTMMVVWGGRAVLIGIVARADDSALALAAWPAAWGLILVIANSTRMVQQIVIKYRGKVTDLQLLKFAISVGSVCSLLLLAMSTTALGDRLVESFIGSDRELIDRIRPVLLLCTGIPLLVAIQNATQGFLVSEGRTGSINAATWISTGTLLTISTLAVQSGVSGALSAAIAMSSAMLVEIGCLLYQRYRRISSSFHKH